MCVCVLNIIVFLSLSLQYRSLLPMYYRNAAAAIIVYDITNEATFEVLQEWITELNRLGPANIVLAIAGNKCDLEETREVSEGYSSLFSSLSLSTPPSLPLSLSLCFLNTHSHMYIYMYVMLLQQCNLFMLCSHVMK